ncbi:MULTISPECIES: helix-turn-helix domain-containing protein [unclassified Paracoccus (in: a-proteobacteria)]|uniref:helix-turn-helix domain-containing protein n=1 Tax=unclassified Paracoccus (in: a-proteobacteria) TaxID=2688777 RepID=UPI000225F637|nr:MULTISPECIES: helix-turn-helix domain-containing protein [unclassified Paracoccus (in: a-proteobacteria)]SMG52308.1 HTH DNA binding domain-containing protein [Paracoccus sp. J56]
MPSASDTDYHEKPPLHELFDVGAWFSAESALAADLARAAFALGRLEGMLMAMEPELRAGANRRLALIEAEAMLWAQGSPLRREEIGRDLMEARAGADLEAMRLARWSIRRLEGQGDPRDLRAFLGLHRAEVSGLDDLLAARPTGHDFDAAAAEFRTLAGELADLTPVARAPALRVLWRLCDLSAPEVLAEPATWTARDMAEGCEGLRFVPLGRHGRGVWIDGGTPAERMARHLAAVTAGIEDARHELARVIEWQARALAAMAGVKGDNPARVIRALAAHPLLSAAMLEDSAGISRDTAERMLARMKSLGLAREITGGRRFRLWMLAG